MDDIFFTDPFRYAPHPLVREAAGKVIDHISSSPELAEAFAEGKMLGVLVLEDGSFLTAFSGNVEGRSRLDGFVPPIYDLLDPVGHFKTREAEITALNHRIRKMEQAPRLDSLKKDLIVAKQDMAEETERMRKKMSERKAERARIRKETQDSAILEELIKESQHEKAGLKRLKTAWEEKIVRIKNDLDMMTAEIHTLKKRRAEMSDELQKWIFNQYIVSNASGERKSIWEIFAEKGLTPPGGTGDCAAPKLLNYAYGHGLKPVAMGEFWYGKSPDTAVRTHGHFYPSCTSKCGPLLAYMMKGLELQKHAEEEERTPDIIYEDEALLAISKPSGMPSVPGLDGHTSVQEHLCNNGKACIAVHRLDMDTSGVLLFAKNQQAAVNLQRQFESHSVTKIYKARLLPISDCKALKTGDTGTICIPLCPDYDERPRQKADMSQGKEARTEYEVESVNEDGSIDIVFHPITGRTHQLRVHSAHTLGLGRPILGDMLYGGFAPAYSGTPHQNASRLHLHALSITFRHPETEQTMTLTSEQNLY